MNYKFCTLGDFQSKNNNQACRQSTNNYSNKTYNTFSFRFISSHECLSSINQLNANKSLGPSCITAWALKDGMIQLVGPLTPADLKKAHVVPIFKKDDPKIPENYRPSSLTGALSKIFKNFCRNK